MPWQNVMSLGKAGRMLKLPARPEGLPVDAGLLVKGSVFFNGVITVYQVRGGIKRVLGEFQRVAGIMFNLA